MNAVAETEAEVDTFDAHLSWPLHLQQQEP